MTAPWLSAPPLSDRDWHDLRHEAIFTCSKWDAQVEDIATIAREPLLLRRGAWDELAGLAEALAAETAALEVELLQRPDLHRQLGLSGAVRAALRGAVPGPAVRVMRFDFHLAEDGWRISEVNADVPGGFNEASGIAALMAARYPGTTVPGDPTATLADALARAAPGGVIALVHATAYSDDRQVMAFLARAFTARGLIPRLVAPDHLAWDRSDCRLGDERIAAITRFFPAEWLPALPRSCGWNRFFAAPDTVLCNPASALLVQSKRLPLVWDALTSPTPTWRRLLPETRSPRDVPWRNDSGWILKPAFGRVGDGVAIPGVSAERTMSAAARAARWWPRHWLAQRRFRALPWRTASGDRYPCIGVYTVDGRAAGAYGRSCATPLIDYRAVETPVLIAPTAMEAAA